MTSASSVDLETFLHAEKSTLMGASLWIEVSAHFNYGRLNRMPVTYWWPVTRTVTWFLAVCTVLSDVTVSTTCTLKATGNNPTQRGRSGLPTRRAAAQELKAITFYMVGWCSNHRPMDASCRTLNLKIKNKVFPFSISKVNTMCFFKTPYPKWVSGKVKVTWLSTLMSSDCNFPQELAYQIWTMCLVQIKSYKQGGKVQVCGHTYKHGTKTIWYQVIGSGIYKFNNKNTLMTFSVFIYLKTCPWS